VQGRSVCAGDGFGSRGGAAIATEKMFFPELVLSHAATRRRNGEVFICSLEYEIEVFRVGRMNLTIGFCCILSDLL